MLNKRKRGFLIVAGYCLEVATIDSQKLTVLDEQSFVAQGLLGAQRYRGIHLAGPAGWDVTG